MRFLFTLLFISFLVSCNSNQVPINQNDPYIDVVSQIETFYKTKYSNAYNFKKSIVENVVELSFELKDKNNIYEPSQFTKFIPVLNASNSGSFLVGDLNGDKVKELVVLVGSEGENGSAVNPDPNYLFIFSETNSKFGLIESQNSESLINGAGRYSELKEINNSHLTASAFFYADDDSESNPTKEYLVKAKFIDNKFKFVSKKFIKKHKAARENE